MNARRPLRQPFQRRGIIILAWVLAAFLGLAVILWGFAMRIRKRGCLTVRATHERLYETTGSSFSSGNRRAGCASTATGEPYPAGPSVYPLVIIVHGWEGYRALHADIAEELASYGYLVAAAVNDGTSGRSGTTGQAVLSGLRGRIDTGDLSLVGHSTGGGAVVLYALGHTDVTSVVGLDAWVEPLGHERLAGSEPRVPALFLGSEAWIGGFNEPYLKPWIARQRALGLPVTFEQTYGTTHEQFSTLYMYAPAARWVGLLGNVAPAAFAGEQRRIIRDFLEET